MEDVSALVARQYEDYPYPPPISDIAESIRGGACQNGDPSIFGPMLWPEGPPSDALKILVAGCGTTQAAWFAYTNRNSEVFGVDLSEESLAHERFLQEKHEIKNLRLFKGDLRDAGKIGDAFDLVICTGVLHHMSDPDDGMRALASILRTNGVMTGMVYAPTRRAGVYLLQDVFRRIGAKADEEGVALARRTLESLPSWHLTHWYACNAPELQHDAALVDTFLHHQDQAYSAPQLLTLVESNGMQFQGWFDNSLYYPEGADWLPDEVRRRIGALPARDQWAVMELLNPVESNHFFIARRGAPPILSFANDDWRRLIPHRRPGLWPEQAGTFRRFGKRFSLDAADLAVFEQIDGLKTLGEINQIVALGSDARTAPALIERLWKQGHVVMTCTSG